MGTLSEENESHKIIIYCRFVTAPQRNSSYRTVERQKNISMQISLFRYIIILLTGVPCYYAACINSNDIPSSDFVESNSNLATTTTTNFHMISSLVSHSEGQSSFSNTNPPTTTSFPNRQIKTLTCLENPKKPTNKTASKSAPNDSYNKDAHTTSLHKNSHINDYKLDLFTNIMIYIPVKTNEQIPRIRQIRRRIVMCGECGALLVGYPHIFDDEDRKIWNYAAEIYKKSKVICDGFFQWDFEPQMSIHCFNCFRERERTISEGNLFTISCISCTSCTKSMLDKPKYILSDEVFLIFCSNCYEHLTKKGLHKKLVDIEVMCFWIITDH